MSGYDLKELTGEALQREAQRIVDNYIKGGGRFTSSFAYRNDEVWEDGIMKAAELSDIIEVLELEGNDYKSAARAIMAAAAGMKERRGGIYPMAILTELEERDAVVTWDGVDEAFRSLTAEEMSFLRLELETIYTAGRYKMVKEERLLTPEEYAVLGKAWMERFEEKKERGDITKSVEMRSDFEEIFTDRIWPEEEEISTGRIASEE